MSTAMFKKLLAGLSFLTCASLSAAPLTVDLNVNGAQSAGLFGDAGNTTLYLDVGANSTVTSVSFDVILTAFSPSLLSELGVVFGDAKFNSATTITELILLNEPGTRPYTDFLELSGDTSFQVGADGLLRVEFFETFDDFLSVDGEWAGTITFGVETVDVEQPGEVPEPSTTLLIGAGLAMLGYARRRIAGKAAA